ncbi:hypothetical protein M2360_004932 [Rhizobium sp. SG_E_25_P2]|uniref:hypothetical protein n=1 Tax=Rhizobium sp. SG_E_25_P2 TaxID=2879942 RepID=UPI0024731539|nr:hypothetical protein [Rhizobium sp. SG_E_25_P2]MDH6269504.1 hypothetical protein [Rhizobium sp. SG_E_25_P2]
MSNQFSSDTIALLADVVRLNRTVYGSSDYLADAYRDQIDTDVDPEPAGNREALFVYDAYDAYLAKSGFTTLSSSDLGFAASEISASDDSDGYDRNFTYSGGLFRNNYIGSGDDAEAFTGAGAVALVTTKANDTGETLYLTFRGTDADGPLADGEAGTGVGQARYYQQLQGLIDQIYDYVSDPDNNITEVVVSGHSLGGTVADLFTIYDGARFAAIDGVDLSVIALASAGIDPAALDILTDFDTSLVSFDEDGALQLATPDWYFQYDQANDIVRNPSSYDAAAHAAVDPTQAVITGFSVGVISDQAHFNDNRLQFETPLIDQYAISANLDTTFLVNHYADLYELIGTEFSKAWTHAGDVTYGRFIALFGESAALRNTSGENNVNGFGVAVDNSVDYGDETANLFILGFSGDDVIAGGSGRDLLEGGDGDDLLKGGARADILLGDVRGAAGDDRLRGGDGSDTFYAGGGEDRLWGGKGADLFVFSRRDTHDVVLDFDGQDKIDVTAFSGIDNWRDLKADHIDIVGRDLVILARHGEDTLTLKHTALADLDRTDFLFA